MQSSSLPQALGKSGVVASVYPDGDLRVNIDGKTWTFNPLCVSPAPHASPAAPSTGAAPGTAAATTTAAPGAQPPHYHNTMRANHRQADHASES